MKKITHMPAGMAVLLVLVGVISGCGSSGGSSSTQAAAEAGTSGEASSPSGGNAGAQKIVEENTDLEGIAYPKPPNEPFDPGTGRMGVVSCGNTGQGCVEMSTEAIKAAKLAGWEPTEPLDGEFNASVQGGIIQRLVAEKVDAIVLIAIEPEPVEAAINAAINAGIPIIDVFSAPAQNFPRWGGPMPMVTASFVEAGELVGAYIAANSEGKTRIDVVTDKAGFPNLAEKEAGMKKMLSKYCPECEVHYTPQPSSELAKPGPPAFSALLSANPPGTLEWVTALTDPFGEPQLKTIKQLGRTDFKVVGADTGPEFVENIGAGGVVQADAVALFRYASWVGVDNVLRQANGLEQWEAVMPSALVTKENVDIPLKELPQSFGTPGFDAEAAFKKEWSGR